MTKGSDAPGWPAARRSSVAEPLLLLGSAFDVDVDACIARLSAGRSATTVERLLPVIERFRCFLKTTRGPTRLSEVDRQDAERFLTSHTSFGMAARVPTIHNRRNALRALFGAARELGLHATDPTLDTRLPAKATRPARPLKDAEIEVGRSAAMWSLTSARYRLVWALAEATARGSELASVAWRDVDLNQGTVSLPGGSRTRARVGEFTDWGVDAMRSNASQSDDSLVVGDWGSGIAGRRVSAANALSAVLVRAGLAGQRDVRPGSVAAWAGRRRMDETGEIAAVARLLGVRSLDVAARMIGWHWQTS